jgi:hypothetical protein
MQHNTSDLPIQIGHFLDYDYIVDKLHCCRQFEFTGGMMKVILMEKRKRRGGNAP